MSYWQDDTREYEVIAILVQWSHGRSGSQRRDSGSAGARDGAGQRRSAEQQPSWLAELAESVVPLECLSEEGGDRERMTANHETYLLMASTQNDMEDWVKSVRRVIWAPFGGGEEGGEDTVRYEKRYGNHLAPMLVEQCVDFIRLRGLKEEGLFRLPGQANLVKELQDAFDCGEKPLFDRNTDVHTVASLLKLYLRELPEPVIPYAKYEDFLSCAKLLSKEEETGLNELVKQVKSLPVVNYNLLKYICRFLDEVQSYSGVNKMSVQNLATVFGPNILRPKVEDPLTIMEGTVVVQQLMS
ncbi:PREDICTED: rho GTPase-activating protein 24-like, partial [Gekko japonicus]|uniref:Rho GTPase-activating protein 24-like n=1 Tax=Gekko japonicus TaxID=146911 RepID=A0ABM1KRS0_GEKJA